MGAGSLTPSRLPALPFALQAAFRGLSAALASQCLPLRKAAAAVAHTSAAVSDCAAVLKRFEWVEGTQARGAPGGEPWRCGGGASKHRLSPSGWVR